jgi:hypothetical protein
LAQPFRVGDAIKSWFGLFNLFLEANQTVIAVNLHALTFSDIATSRKLLQRQLQLITSLRPTTLASDGEVNNLPLAAGLAGARRVDPLKVIQQEMHVLNLLHFNMFPLWLYHNILFHTPLLSLIMNRISLTIPSLLLLKKDGLRISMILLISSCQLQYRLYASFLHENLSNVLLKINAV